MGELLLPKQNTDDSPTVSAIEVSNVSYSYTKKPFISKFNVQIPRGRVVSIVGPNGCGKSTLLKIINGIIRPHAGEVFIDGISCLQMSTRERATRLALMEQGARPPAMDVETLVACGRFPYRKGLGYVQRNDKQQIQEAMEMAGVEKFRHHDVRYLSGGERQRAYVAMILAQDTNIIALDEPTTHLDIYACHEIMQLIRKLNQQSGKTALIVIHDIDLALRYSDFIVVMSKGQLVKMGNVNTVLEARAIDQAFKVDVCQNSIAGKTAFTIFPKEGIESQDNR